jgi:hypothetical protein
MLSLDISRPQRIFQVLMAVAMQISVLWDVAPFTLVIVANVWEEHQ